MLVYRFGRLSKVCLLPSSVFRHVFAQFVSSMRLRESEMSSSAGRVKGEEAARESKRLSDGRRLVLPRWLPNLKHQDTVAMIGLKWKNCNRSKDANALDEISGSSSSVPSCRRVVPMM
jgi:hypothetical protein